MKRPLILLTFVFLIPTPAPAQDSLDVILGLGVGSSELADVYASLNIGGRFRLAPFVVSATFELDISEIPERTGRYVTDSSVDRCRDSQNGQFAATEKCHETVLFYAAVIDAGYPVRRNLFVGAGFRAGDGSTPFVSGTYIWSFDSRIPIHVHLSAWRDYVSLSARFRLL